jgi:sugar/nucleoside kinase (ribokinase family)
MSCPGVALPLFISAVGDDLAGGALTKAWSMLGASVAGVRVCAGAATPVVAAVLDAGGEVAASVADTTTAEVGLDAGWVGRFTADVASAAIVILDGNCTPNVLAAAACAADTTADITETRRPRVWFEPVSVVKSTRAGAAGILPLLEFISPNAGELRAMANEARSRRGVHQAADAAAGLEFMSAQGAVEAMHEDVAVMLHEGVRYVVLTLGAMGVLLSSRAGASTGSSRGGDGNGGGEGGGGGADERDLRGGSGSDAPAAATAAATTMPFTVFYRHFPALPARVSSLVGAGDSLVAGCCAALLAGSSVEVAVAMGVAASRRAIETTANVPVGPSVGPRPRPPAPQLLDLRAHLWMTWHMSRGGSHDLLGW